ncbi:MAG: twin-arginine translocase TatA/TatE family subunit [Gemmatimonadota bacterium]|nr:twin-arginine translocase TatA/TatE family subunit [Gemmatimonadota bacterium]
MFSGIGVTEILFILALLTLIFGAKRIPEIARGLGSGIRNFKGAIRDGSDDDSGDVDKE